MNIVTLRAMHPEVWLVSVRWERDRGAWLQRRKHLFETVPLFHERPVKGIYVGEPGFRRNLLEPRSDTDFLDVVGTAPEAHDGEILKFMGDGGRAVFPIVEERPASEVVMAALEAARWTGFHHHRGPGQ